MPNPCIRNGVFVADKRTNEVYSADLWANYTKSEWMLTGFTPGQKLTSVHEKAADLIVDKEGKTHMQNAKKEMEIYKWNPRFSFTTFAFIGTYPGNSQAAFQTVGWLNPMSEMRGSPDVF